jgi:hypothetical protein
VSGDSGTDPIQEFYEACLDADAATVTSCNEFHARNAACAACILTPQSAAYYGPLIDFPGYLTPNVAGCLEVAPGAGGTLEPGALSCAKAVQALAGCELAACQANCPVQGQTSFEAYERCAAAAATSGCAAWATAASCASSEADAGGLASACLGSFQTFYDAIVPLFCGPPTATPQLDAGLDAGSVDAGSVDAGSGGPGLDAGSPDAASDGPTPDGKLDAGDAGRDAGTKEADAQGD